MASGLSRSSGMLSFGRGASLSSSSLSSPSPVGTAGESSDNPTREVEWPRKKARGPALPHLTVQPWTSPYPGEKDSPSPKSPF